MKVEGLREGIFPKKSGTLSKPLANLEKDEIYFDGVRPSRGRTRSAAVCFMNRKNYKKWEWKTPNDGVQGGGAKDAEEIVRKYYFWITSGFVKRRIYAIVGAPEAISAIY